jgi:hypothetical protein
MRGFGGVGEPSSLMYRKRDVWSGVTGKLKEHPNDRGVVPFLIGCGSILIGPKRFSIWATWSWFTIAVPEIVGLKNLVHKSSLGQLVLVLFGMMLNVNPEVSTDRALHCVFPVVRVTVILETLHTCVHDILIFVPMNTIINLGHNDHVKPDEETLVKRTLSEPSISQSF